MAKDPNKVRKGRYAKQKGAKEERKIAADLTELGVPSRRVVMSGAAAKFDSRLGGDVQIGLLSPASIGAVGRSKDHLLCGESKARGKGQGFKTIEGWLGEHDVLFLRRNYKTPLVIMPWEQWTKLLVAGYKQLVPEWRKVLREFKKEQEKARSKRSAKGRKKRRVSHKKNARQNKVQPKGETQRKK